MKNILNKKYWRKHQRNKFSLFMLTKFLIKKVYQSLTQVYRIYEDIANKKKISLNNLAKIYLRPQPFFKNYEMQCLKNSTQQNFRKLKRNKQESIQNKHIEIDMNKSQQIDRETYINIQQANSSYKNLTFKHLIQKSPYSTFFKKRNTDKLSLEIDKHKIERSPKKMNEKNIINHQKKTHTKLPINEIILKSFNQYETDSTFFNLKQQNQTNIQSIKQKKQEFRIAKSYKMYRYPPTYNNVNKIFILNSKDDHIRRLLERYGWKENKNYYSNNYLLKWSYKQQLDQYKTIDNLEKKDKFYNHIKGNQMTNKYGLMKLQRHMNEYGIKTRNFIPRTYQISDQNQIKKDYELTALLIVLKKHIKYIKEVCNLEFQTIVKLIQRKKKKGIQEQNLKNFLKRKSFNAEHNSDFILNIPLIIKTLELLQMERKNKDIQFLEQEQENDQSNQHNPEQYRKIIKTLIKFSHIEPPYNRYLQIKKSHIEQQYLNSEKVMHEQKKKYLIQSWATPSIQLIYKIIYYYEYFKQNMPEFMYDGLENIWIIKPTNSSRGIGIFLTNKLDVIHQNRQRNKIVQKYIEDIWIFDQNKLNTISDDNQDKIIYQYHRLINKKFDIRQFVLITSVNPLQVYIFNKFYLKICSQDYFLGDIKNLSKHLSNYSINKNNFQVQSESIVSQDEFEKILKVLGLNLQPIKSKIDQIITDTIMVGSQQLEHIQGTFQILGFDIMLDSQLNPWIIEINMSPACAQRSIEITKMLDQMALSTLNLVLPKSVINIKQQQIRNNTYKWQTLIKECKTEIRNIQKLQIDCRKLNVNLQRNRQKYFNINIQKKIILLQRKFRQFIKKNRSHHKFIY